MTTMTTAPRRLRPDMITTTIIPEMVRRLIRHTIRRTITGTEDSDPGR